MFGVPSEVAARVEVAHPRKGLGECQLRLDPGGRPVPIFDTGRRLNRLFRTSPRFTLDGTEQRVRVPGIGTGDPARGYGLELYEWRPATAPARPR